MVYVKTKLKELLNSGSVHYRLQLKLFGYTHTAF